MALCTLRCLGSSSSCVHARSLWSHSEGGWSQVRADLTLISLESAGLERGWLRRFARHTCFASPDAAALGNDNMTACSSQAVDVHFKSDMAIGAV